tara:strand:- start:1803 stop:2237 length:435 start_codon:yes stop_codon:yes gene_type:complete
MEIKTLFALEDTYMRMPGLYALWTTLFITNLAVLGVDSTTGPSRDFNLYTSLLSTLYCGAASYNTIYGNGKPSSMLMMVGPIHQYCFWLLLAFYQGDVYGKHELGVLNAVYTAVVGLFSLDMVAKTWFLAATPKKYLDYVKQTV